ncbi:LOW QUALITY PROTEIN: protein ripply1 [Amazona ochrocephala]
MGGCCTDPALCTQTPLETVATPSRGGNRSVEGAGGHGLASGGSGRRRPRQSTDVFQPPGQVSAVQPGAPRAAGGLTRLTTHLHRLLWPKSKCFDYLYAVGEKLLENFPVQATLCLYEDSGSEEEDEEEEDEEEEDEEEEDEEDEEEEDEEEAGAVPAGPPPHAGSDARPAVRAATGAAAGDTGPRR